MIVSMTELARRRRRTRAEARSATREAIVSAARRLFAERGYRGASLDDIAEVAGFSKGAVYSNWPSKEMLFLELLDTASADQPSEGLSTEPTGWALATLDFFIEAIRNPDMRAALADRYREARRSIGPGLAGSRPDPAWATWEELASVAMALGSGLIIQAAIDDQAVEPTLAGRVMRHLLDDAR
jgi:AcrR family transcriptional regulator